MEDTRINRDAQRSPDRRRQDRVADHLVRALERYGIERVFGIPGGAISPMFDALIDSGIEVVTCQHEGTAGYMAMGYARATGLPGVLLVTSGPGILNAVTPIAAAHLDQVPLLVICGDVKRSQEGRGALQDGSAEGIDITSVLRPIARMVETISWPERSSSRVHHAIETALEFPRGPVVLRVPSDVATAVVPPTETFRSRRSSQPADPTLCAMVARQLTDASKPAIWLGVGARAEAVGPIVLRIAERCRIPVICDVEAKGVFPESHALSMGIHGVGSIRMAEDALESVDFLLVVGARLDDTTTNGFEPLLAHGGTVVQLDHDASRLNRFALATTTTVCDLRATLERIDGMTVAPAAFQILSRDAAVRAQKRKFTVPFPAPLRRGPHDPGAVIRALQAALGPDTVFTSDIGNHLIHAIQGLRMETPDFHVSNGLGGMGSGVGMAMGLAAAFRGTRRVVAVCGDGTVRMVGNELATCAALGIPVTLAVFNDGQLGMVNHGNTRVFQRSEYCTSPEVDFVAYARSLGVAAVRIDSQADLDAAAKRVGTGPLLLEFPIDASVRAPNPRERSFSFPTRS